MLVSPPISMIMAMALQSPLLHLSCIPHHQEHLHCIEGVPDDIVHHHFRSRIFHHSVHICPYLCICMMIWPNFNPQRRLQHILSMQRSSMKDQVRVRWSTYRVAWGSNLGFGQASYRGARRSDWGSGWVSYWRTEWGSTYGSSSATCKKEVKTVLWYMMYIFLYFFMYVGCMDMFFLVPDFVR